MFIFDQTKFKIMEVTRIFDILDRYQKNFQKEDALAGKVDKKWVTYSTNEYISYVNNFSYGLLALGLKKGDKIATISNNRPEWNFADMGMSQIGVIHVPIYPTISEEEYAYILEHAEPKIIMISDKPLFDILKPIIEKNKFIEDTYTFNEIEGAKNWKEIVELGKQNADKFKDKLLELKAGIKPEDILTLIYTSGTTGFPKGVMLSHHNIVSNCIATANVHPYGFESKCLSFLPLSHIYERMVNYHYQYKGIGIYYAESLVTIADNLKEVKPDIFSTVPRLLERVYDRIIGKGKELTFLKKNIFFWAVNLGLKFKLHRKNSWWYYLKLKLADKLIFSKWREALGGNTKIIVSGGAALQPRLATIFWAANIPILEGYGLTETSPVIAAGNLNTMEIKFGAVGPVINEVEVKIADDGEILCRGPNVMLGYYKQPDLTKEVIDQEGWFHTGDVGIIEDNKYLKITDRKKEIFKLSSGKYVAPQVIENKFKESFFIEQIMVVGENEKFASALVSPNFSYLHNWATDHHIKFQDNTDLIRHPKVLEVFQKEVNQINKELAFHEQIKRFRLVTDEWTPQTGELSPTT
ncbi:MAG: AMP-binding protein, partial [Bacteroidetes bacterium]|nr:AMP-binding protein [Bacteroidota bacterium]